MSERWKEILKFNIKTKGTPKLVNKDKLDERFEFCNDNVINDARGYFKADPTIWKFPAKNYFVRICLAFYVSKTFGVDMLQLLNDEELLPYEDAYAPLYAADTSTYDAIMEGIDIQNSYGYMKTIEVFGYLYENIIKEKSLTLGYNLTGQDFFDTICFKKKYITEFFFSLTHKMPLQPLCPEDIIKQFVGVNTYGIPGNLILNTDQSQGNWKTLLKMAMDVITVRAVTVLDITLAREIKNAFPDIKIHISTHGAQDVDPNDLDSDLIEAFNVCEPFFYEERELLAACREKGIKIKYIANRGCVVGKQNKLSALFGHEVKCGEDYPCVRLLPQKPWIDLIRTNIYKESLQYYQPDLIKISTREQTNARIKTMLDYWTSPNPTQRLNNIPIHKNNYDIFLSWVKQRYYCNGDCPRCMKCKAFYEELIQ